jgi:23S rRNA (guanosine2251-2'-O)-methyltransferase
LIWLWGIHPVRAALANKARRNKKIIVSQGVEPDLVQLANRNGVSVEQADAAAIARNLPREAVHQGVALLTTPLEELDLEGALESAPSPCCVLLLDQVTDPHNLGAVIRSAAAFGASAVIVQDRHSPPEGGVLAKSASGALEAIPVIRVVNLSRTLEQLAERGFLRLALADEAAQPIETTDLKRDVVLALGAEGQGLRRLTRENCDLAIRLPTSKAMPSLNVSNAAAVALYAWAAATKSK